MEHYGLDGDPRGNIILWLWMICVGGGQPGDGHRGFTGTGRTEDIIPAAAAAAASISIHVRVS